MNSKNITVILTGGTIGSTVEDSVINIGDSSIVVNEYKKKYDNNAEFNIINPFNILSENSNPKMWDKLSSAIDSVYEQSDGIIITHGTDTLSYTSAYIALKYAGTKKPIIFVASNHPIGHEKSNGLCNFKNAVDFINNESFSGIFTIFKNSNDKALVHIASRLIEADNYNDDFTSYGNVPYGVMEFGRFVKYSNDVNPKAFMLKDKKPINYLQPLNNEIFIIRAYPGLDYEAINFVDKPKAVLHIMYHSGTASTSSGKYSLLSFIERCNEENIDVYALGFKSKEFDKYKTAHDIINTGAIPIYNTSIEAAYAKLIMAYNQDKMQPEDFMEQEIYFEVLRGK